MSDWPELHSPEDADATHRWARECLAMWEAERDALQAEVEKWKQIYEDKDRECIGYVDFWRSEALKAESERDALQAEVDRLQDEVVIALGNPCASCQAESDRMAFRIGELEQALREYGAHKDACAWQWTRMRMARSDCDCGLEAALHPDQQEVKP